MGQSGNIMADFVFAYTQTIILICMGAAVVSLCVFLATRRRSDLAKILVFSSFMFENSLALLDEYDGTKELFPFSADSFLPPHPMAHHVISFMLVFGAWMLVCEMLELRSTKALVVFPALVSVMQIAVFVTIGKTPLGQQLFFLIRDISGIFLAGILSILAMQRPEVTKYPQVVAKRRIIVLVLVLLLAVVAEDLFVTIAGPIRVAEFFSAGFIIERSITENILTVVCAVIAIRNGAGLLSLRYSDSSSQPSSELLLEEEGRFRRFAVRYELTERERDLLELIIMGKSNREISQELFISEGTVRSHVSHIFSKCEAASRDELVRLFWKQE